MKDLLFSVFPSENFVDFSLYQFGWERCAPSHTFGPAARTHFLFHYVLSGTGALFADDDSGDTKTYQIKTGQGFMIFPGQINTYVADRNLPWEYVWIEFDGLRAREAVETMGLSRSAPVYRTRSHELREAMAQEMMYIAKNGHMAPFHLMGHLYLFLDALTRSVATTRITKGRQLRPQPQLFRQDLPRGCGAHAPGISFELPHGKGRRAVEAHSPVSGRYRQSRRIRQRPAFLQGL